MELMKIVLPDGLALVTHDSSQEHIDRVIRHWVDQHSDVYELPTIRKGQVAERARDSQTGEWLYEDPSGQVVKSRDGDAHIRPGSNLRPIKEHKERVIDVGVTTKRLPPCRFDLVDMPEPQYRGLKPYEPHPTCRLLA